jgi:hypothetical protein
VSVQIFADKNHKLLISEVSRAELSEDLKDEWTLTWLPSIASGTDNLSAGHHETSTVIIYFLGLAFETLVKPTIEEVGKEAGKDLWKTIKRLVAKLYKAQCDNSYGVDSTIYLVLKLRDEYCAITFNLAELGPEPAREAVSKRSSRRDWGN